jgi:hypothetical protein
MGRNNAGLEVFSNKSKDGDFPMTDEIQNTPKTEPNPLMPSPLIGSMRPIILKTKKKKKRKYSKGLRDIQTSGRRLTKISDDLSRSVSKGIRAYRKASDKSSRKKRDGAVRDFGLNAAKGIGKSMRSSSSVPYKIARALNTRGTRRGMRRQARAWGRMNRILGWR